MKNLNFSHKKAFLKALSLGLALLFASMTFTGCQQPEKLVYEDKYIFVLPPEKSSEIVGDWADTYPSHYKITPTSLKNYGEGYESYEGDNLCILWNDETSGTIFIKYTKAFCAEHSTYDSDAQDVGKWYAISFKGLTDSNVKISGAYKEDGATSKETLEEAIAEFTVANGYFGTYSDCIKN